MNHGEMIGEGEYKEVFEHAANASNQDGIYTDKVYARFITPLTHEQIKSLFYLSKIAHLLFPLNIPDVHYARNEPLPVPGDAPPGTPPSFNSYFEADKVKTDFTHRAMQSMISDFTKRARETGSTLPTRNEQIFFAEHERMMEKDPRVADFMARFDEAGFCVDTGSQNYSFDEKGNVQYLDLDPARMVRRVTGPNGESNEMTELFERNKLEKAIETLPEPEREKAQLYFKRLIELTDKDIYNASGSQTRPSL